MRKHKQTHMILVGIIILLVGMLLGAAVNLFNAQSRHGIPMRASAVTSTNQVQKSSLSSKVLP